MGIEVKIKVCSMLARVAGYATPGAAAFDLVAAESQVIYVGETQVIKTGIKVEIPDGYVGLICPRSGLAAKESLTVLNAPGVIDSDYRGEVMVILHNAGQTAREIKVGERIAQMMIQKVERANLRIVEVLGDTDRGEGGLGSTGK